jgi:NADPH2:quinone reductase
MRAVVVSEAGGPDRLRVEEVDEPTAGPGEMVVRIEWAGVNYIDTYHRGGLYPMDYPFTPGLEGAGAVITVGDGVEGFSACDRVGWLNVLGSYSEKVVVSTDKAIPIPDEVGTDMAAAVLLQGITAHYLATDTFDLQPGHRCLIHAGAGGVGLLLTQMAAMRGAHVITTVGSREKAELSKDAGSEEVIVYTEVDFKDAVEASLGPQALDVVYDGVGAATFDASLDLLRPRGMMVTFGNASGPAREISPMTLMQKGSIYLTRPTMAHYIRTREELMSRVDDLFGWIGAGSLRVRIGERFSLERAADAHRALEGRATTGKVLLHP